MRSTTAKILLPCLALVLASAGTARAELAIKIFEGSNTPYEITGPSGTSLNIDATSTALWAAAPDISWNGNATSNPSSGFGVTSTLNASQGQLEGVGTFYTSSAYPTSTSPAPTLTIEVTDTGYTNPAGPNYVMGSSSGYTALPGTTDSATFQSFATAGQVAYGTGVASPGATYSSLGLSDSSNEAPTSFGASSGYTLTQIYTWTLSGDGSSYSFQPTGTTIVNAAAVPEPGSLMLLGVGSIGILVLRLRRRA